MSTVRKVTRFGLLGLPLAAIAVLVLVLAWGHSTTEPTEASGPARATVTLKRGDLSFFEKVLEDRIWSIGVGGYFQLNFELTKIPESGYIGFGTEVDVDGLTYVRKVDVDDEIVWPDVVLPVRSQLGSVINHGGTTGLLPPFPLSNFVGKIVQLNLKCTEGKSTNTVKVVPLSSTNTDGSGLKLTATTSEAVTADSITINCVNPPPATATPTPTATPEFPSFQKKPGLQNLFLTRQGAKIPPANCKASSDNVVTLMQLNSPIAVVPDPKDPLANQELGAFEFEVKYDQTKVCVDITEGPAATAMTCFIQDANNSQLDGVARIGCVTLGKTTFPNTASPTGRILAILTVRPQPNEYSIIKPNQDNGNVTQILNVGCSLSDLQGHPIKSIGCLGADVTIRYLEGDVVPSCTVNALDAAAIAARWGASKGNLLYNDFYNLEPVIPADQDIDINDIQFVFGRFGSTCGSPHPAQDPVNPKA